MTKKSKLIPTTEVLVPDQKPMNQLAVEIDNFHLAAKQHAEAAVTNAICCGLLCLHAKQITDHGHFKKWFNGSVQHVSYETATRYMRIAKELKNVTVTFLESPQTHELPNALRDSNFKKTLLAEVHEFASGRSLTELYCDYGILKPNKQDLFGTNNPDGKNGPKGTSFTPEQLELFANDAFYGKKFGIITQIEKMGDEDPTRHLYNHLRLEQLGEATEILDNFTKHLKEVLKNRKKKERQLIRKGGK